MKLSRREQILLSVLAIIGLLAVGFYLVYQPLTLEYEKLKMIKTEKQAEYDQAILKIAQIEKLTSEIMTLSNQINTKTGQYFPSIIQEQIVLMMNALYGESQIQVLGETFTMNVNYSTPKQKNNVASEANALDMQTIITRYGRVVSGQADSAENEVTEQVELSADEQSAAEAAIKSINAMGQNIHFVATYGQAVDLVSRIESLNRSILVKNLIMTANEEIAQSTGPGGEVNIVTTRTGLLDCTFDLVFNAIPKLTAQDEAYEAWILTGTYGKVDPFIK